MAAAERTSDVLLLPLIDVNWLTFAPFDPKRDFRIDPPKVEQSVGEVRALHRIMNGLTGGLYILTPHSGTYCRTGYYEGAMLEVYRQAVAGGGELAVHLHEEIKGGGVRFGEEDHVRAVFADCARRLRDAGIDPVAYRGGHYAYAPFMNRVLADHGIAIDCSCAPGMNHPDREAVWTEAGTSGYYLPEDPRAAPGTGRASGVFEIPIGADGQGADYANLLHVEQSELDNLQRIWGVIRDRARAEGRPQIVHVLFHSGSMGRKDWVERFKRFMDWVPSNGGTFVSAVEAKRAHDAMTREAAA
ncbi:MAG: hypothetical protein RID91_08500 [Azospirillaceae bacterium]